MQKYAICYVSFTPENDKIVWLTNSLENKEPVWVTGSPLAWVSELKDATFWEERVLAEDFLSKTGWLDAGFHNECLSLVTINC